MLIRVIGQWAQVETPINYDGSPGGVAGEFIGQQDNCLGPNIFEFTGSPERNLVNKHLSILFSYAGGESSRKITRYNRVDPNPIGGQLDGQDFRKNLETGFRYPVGTLLIQRVQHGG